MKWAGLFALLTTFVLMLPTALMKLERRFYETRFPEQAARWSNNGSFSAVDTFTMAEDNYCYAAKIRQAGTEAMPGDPFIKSNRSARLAARDTLTFWAYGLFFRGFKDISRAWIAAQTFFLLFWVPCLYLVLTAAGAGRRQAIATAVAVTLFADLARALVLGGPLGEQLKQAFQYSVWLLGSYHYFMGPTRVTGPVMTYPCLFGAALAFCWAAKRKDWLSVLAAGFAGGSLAFVHSDVWTVYGGAIFLYFVVEWVRSKSADPRLVAALAASALPSLAWVWLNRGVTAESALLGIEAGRKLDFGSWPFLLGAWLAYKRAGRTPMGLWLACALASVFIARNSSLVVGVSVDGIPNWAFIGNILLALVAGLWIGGRKHAESERWLWAAALFCALALPRAVSYAAQHFPIQALPKDREAALRWLDENTPKDSVVAALSPMTNFTIPTHTHNGIAVAFLCPHLSDIPVEENAQRADYLTALYGVGMDKYWAKLQEPSDWGKSLWGGVVDVEGRERGMWRGTMFCNLPEEAVGRLLAGASAGRAGKSFPVDYLWQGSFERGLMSKDKPAVPAAEVYRNASVVIYQLKK